MKNSISNKIATYAILFLMFESSIRLLSKNIDWKSPTCLGGGFLLSATIILSIIFFLDYRYKEYVDNTIEQQNSAIKNLSSALTEKTKTGNAVEKFTRDTLKNQIGNSERGHVPYSPEKSSETLTE